MSRLGFHIDFGSHNPGTGALPVEVRRSNLSLVTRSMSSETIELDPGRYHVTARLPGGQELETPVELGQHDTTVVLQPIQPSPHEWLAQRHFLIATQESLLDDGGAAFTSPTVLRASVNGTLLLQLGPTRLELTVLSTWPDGEAVGEVTLGAADAHTLELYVNAGAAPLPRLHAVVTDPSGRSECVTHLPVAAHGSLRVIITLPRGDAQPLEVDPHLANGDAEALVRYLDDFDGDSARVMANTTMRAEELLFSKVQDPLGAAVGAYALLRCESLDQLHEWTANLCDLFPWLPDGAAIRGEHAARRGNHDEAAARFLEMATRGLPLLRQGVTFAISRLRTYANAPDWLAPRVVLESTLALARLIEATRFLDATEPYTTLRIPHFPPPKPPKGEPRPPKRKMSPQRSEQPRETADTAPSMSVTIPLHVTVTVGVPQPGLTQPMTTAAVLPPRSQKLALDPELNAALTALKEAREAEYYEAERDAADRERYYAGIELGDDHGANLERLTDLLTRTHETQPKYNPKSEVYPWVDLRRELILHSIYSDAEMDPEDTILDDFDNEERLEEALESLHARETTLGAEAVAAEAAQLEASFAFNCEHVVPQSWFNKREPMRGDIHHLFACEPRCNSFRGNTPFFQFETERTMEKCGRSEAGAFEPAAGKGAVARAVLYFLVRYPGEINSNAKEYEPSRVATLLMWHEQFPPDEYERHRNQAIFDRQGNRNPFIDFPEWAGRVDFVAALGN